MNISFKFMAKLFLLFALVTMVVEAYASCPNDTHWNGQNCVKAK